MSDDAQDSHPANPSDGARDPLQVNDEQVETARIAAVEAIRACRAAATEGVYEDRLVRREFDPTWKTMRACVVAYTQLLKGCGLDAEAAVAAIKVAVSDAAPDLAPHNAIRSAAVGWCVRAYFSPGGSL